MLLPLLPSFLTNTHHQNTPQSPLNQLYRVNVLLQAPDAPDAAAALARPPFFVLRRYSHFRQLFLDVRAHGWGAGGVVGDGMGCCGVWVETSR